MMWLLIIFGILIVTVLVGGIYLILKSIKSLSKGKVEVKITDRPVTSDVIRDGVKSAIKELSYEDEQEKLFIKKSKQPENVFTSIEQDNPVKHSGGNLVPYNLTDEQKEILEMFYGEN